MATSDDDLVEELRGVITRLRAALEYWLPDEASVSSEDHPIWQRHFALLVGDAPQPAAAAAAEISAPEPCAVAM